jgi:ABC-type branched-subunit amino acid transport system ATPase component/branched-subunit amino acid ABC-type transport system permease component
LLPFLIVGLVSGSVYALAATGLVLTYKTSGIFNFAYGAIAATAVYVFYFLHVDHGMPWPIAGFISVFLLGPFMGLGFELVARRVIVLGAAWQVLATVGVVVAVEAGAAIWYGSNTVPFPPYLPTQTFGVGGVNIGYDQLITILVGLVVLVGVHIMLRRTRLGTAMRAVVDSPELLDLRGYSPVRVRRAAWIIGSTLAALSGVLIAPSLNLDAGVLVLLVVQAFGAAAIGYFASLPLTYAGGLILGIGISLTTKYIQHVSWLSGLPASLPFIVLFIVLVITPRRRLARQTFQVAKATSRSWQAPMHFRLAAGAVVAVLLLLAPNLVGDQLTAYTAALVYTILFLSLGFLVKLAGQVSLAHFGFAAIGAASFAHIVAHGVPWGLAVVLGACVAIPVGAIVAIPAIRLSGVFLALATFAFGVLLEQLLYASNWMFGPTINGLEAPRPAVAALASTTGFYYVVLIFVAVTVTTLTCLQYGRAGRLLGGLSQSRVALETNGASTNVILIALFCISAFFAAVAGALLASLYGFATGPTFSSFSSLTLFAVLLVIFAGAPWYAFIAGAAYVLVPAYVTVSGTANYLNLAFGVSAIYAALIADRAPGMPAFIRKLLAPTPDQTVTSDAAAPQVGAGAGRSPRRAPTRHDEAGVAAPARRTALTGQSPARNTPAIAVDGITVKFGGLVALDDVGLQVSSHRITGLIGPNGAGKTTLFNVCSGLLRPTHGTVSLAGVDVTRHGSARRARQGLGRTFQRVELWESLSVAENISLGREAGIAGRRITSQLVAKPGDRKRIERATAESMEITGLTPLRDVAVRNLSTGQRRLVELARCLGGTFDVLLLDEPSSGLDPAETLEFGRILNDVVDLRGTAILLVEHDMSLVMSVCEHIYVLDFGRLIFAGTPGEVGASDVVRAAYLGGGLAGASAMVTDRG